MIKILLTSAGGELSPLISKKLKENKKFKNIKVFGIDQSDHSINKHFFDDFYKVSKNKFKYLRQLKYIVKKRKINLILPGSDEEALILSSNRKLFETNNLKIACAEAKYIKIFSDKISTLKVLQKNKINVGNWQAAQNRQDLLKKIRFFFRNFNSVVIKPSI